MSAPTYNGESDLSIESDYDDCEILTPTSSRKSTPRPSSEPEEAANHSIQSLHPGEESITHASEHTLEGKSEGSKAESTLNPILEGRSLTADEIMALSLDGMMAGASSPEHEPASLPSSSMLSEIRSRASTPDRFGGYPPEPRSPEAESNQSFRHGHDSTSSDSDSGSEDLTATLVPNVVNGHNAVNGDPDSEFLAAAPVPDEVDHLNANDSVPESEASLAVSSPDEFQGQELEQASASTVSPDEPDSKQHSIDRAALVVPHGVGGQAPEVVSPSFVSQDDTESIQQAADVVAPLVPHEVVAQTSEPESTSAMSQDEPDSKSQPPDVDSSRGQSKPRDFFADLLAYPRLDLPWDSECMAYYKQYTSSFSNEHPVRLPCGHLIGDACIKPCIKNGTTTCPVCGKICFGTLELNRETVAYWSDLLRLEWKSAKGCILTTRQRGREVELAMKQDPVLTMVLAQDDEILTAGGQ